MLDLSYIVSGKLHLARDTVAFSVVVQAAVEDAAGNAAATGVSLQAAIEPAPRQNSHKER